MSTCLDNLEARFKGKRPAGRRVALARPNTARLPTRRIGASLRSALEPSVAPVPPARSPNARLIAEWFGLPVHEYPARALRTPLPPGLTLPPAGRIMLITGPSGAGKSSLLRALACRRRDVININRIRLKTVPCVDQFAGDIELGLDLLSRVGLAEAFTYMQLPRELSDGQRWRLRLAVGIAQAMRGARSEPEKLSAPLDRAGKVLVADEFCAVLDRVTAGVVARSLRRTIDRLCAWAVPISAVLATSHDDLGAALMPDMIVRCDFGALTISGDAERSAR